MGLKMKNSTICFLYLLLSLIEFIIGMIWLNYFSINLFDNIMVGMLFFVSGALFSIVIKEFIEME